VRRKEEKEREEDKGRFLAKSAKGAEERKR
jgi:hypothetical protein